MNRITGESTSNYVFLDLSNIHVLKSVVNRQALAYRSLPGIQRQSTNSKC